MDVLENMEMTEGDEGGDGDGLRVKRSRQEVRPRSEFPQSAVVYIVLRKVKRRDSREAGNFRRNFLILYEFFLKLVKLSKQRRRKRFSSATMDVAERQCIYLWS